MRQPDARPAGDRRADPGPAVPVRVRPPSWSQLRRGASAAFDGAKRFQANEGFVLSGYIAFAALLAIFPFAIFCASLAAATTGPEEIEALSRFLVDALPPQVAGAIGPPLTSALSLEGRGVLTVSGVGAVWAASNGVEAFRVAFERAYRSENPRHWIVNRLIGMAAVIFGAVAATLMGFAVVLAPLILATVEGLFGIDAPIGLGVVRYGVALAAFALLLYLMHWTLPSARRPHRIWPGIWATLGVWSAAATAFSVYLTFAPSYSVTYGTLSGVIVTLLFFYLSGAVIIFGAELNAAMDRQTRAEARRAEVSGGPEGDDPSAAAPSSAGPPSAIPSAKA
ncbi:MAG: YihY/virulence factor BrkB family protein [Pseudomonadota bacterium]